MIQKKVCMLGAFAVGKTSLVSRYVKSIFSETYHTTVGVKIDKKAMDLDDQKVNLIIWDLHGEDEFQKVRMSYLRGSSGYILVADGTRRMTLDKVMTLQQRAEETIGKVPFILLINKLDQSDEWELEESRVRALTERGWTVLLTSAKTGVGVEDAFNLLTRKMMDA